MRFTRAADLEEPNNVLEFISLSVALAVDGSLGATLQPFVHSQ